MTIFWILLGCVIGTLVYRHYIVVPLWDTEEKLRKEIGKLRGGLWVANLEVSNLRTWVIMHHLKSTPESKIPHRAHSEVLKIHSIDDLIEGTKR